MQQKYWLALSLSVALHAALALVMFFGDFTTAIKPTPVAVTVSEVKPIKAVAVDQSKLQAQVNKLKKQKADAKAKEAKRLKDLERRANEAKKKRANEEARIKNLEKQRKKKEAEKKQADDAAKKSKAQAAKAEKDRKRKEAEKKRADKAAADAKAKKLKAEAEAKKAEQRRKKKEAERKKKEAERKRKAKEAAERARQEKLLEQQMAEEMASRQQARRQQMMTEISRYTALITQTIQRNLITDQSTMEGKSCKLTISLAPSGFVTNVVTGQGDRTVCDAAQKAVYKAGTLPVSKDPEVFKEMSSISLTVVPEF